MKGSEQYSAEGGEVGTEAWANPWSERSWSDGQKGHIFGVTSVESMVTSKSGGGMPSALQNMPENRRAAASF